MCVCVCVCVCVLHLKDMNGQVFQIYRILQLLLFPISPKSALNSKFSLPLSLSLSLSENFIHFQWRFFWKPFAVLFKMRTFYQQSFDFKTSQFWKQFFPTLPHLGTLWGGARLLSWPCKTSSLVTLGSPNVTIICLWFSVSALKLDANQSCCNL